MEKFETLKAIACPLGLENVDTDQIIPARFMSRSRAQGYGGFLLHDMRFDDNGVARGFLLDNPRYHGACILVARRNFGTGSSREAAVYALSDFGIRCVIAPSFGDIFSSNATKNGLLTAMLPADEIEALLLTLETIEKPVLMVDLAMQTIGMQGQCWRFSIDAVRRLQLLNGWDDLDVTLQYQDQISQFRQTRHERYTWSVPALPQRE
ncbi:MAG: 3-isopropylmalate dehydratase small subunit [Beijerinckiaceae bacterium]